MSNVFFVDPYYQFKGKNGRLNVGGSVSIFKKNTSDYADVYEADGNTRKVNPFKIDNNGRAAFKLDENFTYRMEVKDPDNKLLWTCGLDKNGIVDVQTFYDVVEELSGKLPAFGWTVGGDVSAVGTITGGISAIWGAGEGGIGEVKHDNTLSGKGTTESPLGVSPLTTLAVDDTMTAYTDTIEGKEALVLGVNGEYFDSKMTGYVPTATFNTYKTEVENKFNTKQDNLTFGYNQGKIISINTSALSAGTTYQAGENIDITSDIISVTGKKNLKTDNTLSITRSGSDVILGINGDILSGKQDKLSDAQLSAISSVSSISSNLETNYYKKTETSSNAELNTAFNNKQDKLSTEQISAISSVSSLAEDLLDEVEDRENADIALGQRIDGKQDTLTFGYTDNKISSINTSAIYCSGGSNYTAGDNINITDNVISGRDWTPELNKKQDKLTAGENITIDRSGSEIKEKETTSLPVSFISNGDALIEYQIFGTFYQEGTPALESPKDIKGVGPTVNIKRNGNLLGAIFLNDPLYVINDKADYVSFLEKKEHRWSKKMDLSNFTWTAELSSGRYRFYTTLPDFKPSVTAGRDPKVYLNRFYYSSQDVYGVGFGHSNGRLYIYVDSSVQTVADLSAWLITHESYVVYPTEEQILDVNTIPTVYTESGLNEIDITPVRPSKIYIKYVESASEDLIISSKDWSTDISNAVTGKQDKLTFTYIDI